LIEELYRVLPEHPSGVITKSTHCLLITAVLVYRLSFCFFEPFEYQIPQSQISK